MAAKNWVFTLNNVSDAELTTLIDFCESEAADAVFQFIVFQKEEGLEGTPHLQGYIQLKSKRRLNGVKAVLNPRVHLEIAKGGPYDNLHYCTKDEGRLDGPWKYGLMIGGQGRRTDLVDFVRRAKQGVIPDDELIESYPGILAKYPRFVATVQRHYAKPQPINFIPRPGWQLELTLDLAQPADSRSVRWYWERVGNSGKSYYSLNYLDGGRRPGYVVTGGRHADIYYAYKNESVVFFDWARDNEDNFPYRVLENFKNGYFLNTKYETHAHRFPIPHVVVFANFEPDISKLSNDRWIIKHI